MVRSQMGTQSLVGGDCQCWPSWRRSDPRVCPDLLPRMCRSV